MQIPWVIDEHTKIKHALLKRYISPWMKILYQIQSNMNFPEILIYVDAFAGPGLYFIDESKNTTCNGSPIIVAKAANEYIKQKSSRKFYMYCMDKKKECFDMLRNELAKENIYNQKWVVFNAEFKDIIDNVLVEIDREGLEGQPMFFFIDPFGYSGYPIKKLGKIMKFPRAELFINLMVYDLVRFCEEDKFEKNITELFGNKKFKKINDISLKEERHSFLLNLYYQSLKDYAGAKYIMPFRVNTPNRGTRPRYYLIHASKNLKALKVMKDGMAKYSESQYNFEAIGINSEQMSLFEDPDKVELIERIKSYCKEQHPAKVEYNNVQDWAYANTNGVDKTIKEALIHLEKNKKIKIERLPRQRSNTVTEGAKIQFIKGLFDE